MIDRGGGGQKRMFRLHELPQTERSKAMMAERLNQVVESGQAQLSGS